MAKLKVFAARMGFYETVIAAPSQKAALEAWGTHQNLFHEGAAGACDDPAAVKAALAQPGVLLRRRAGSRDPYAMEAQPAPAVAPRKPTGPKAAPKAKRPKPERGALDKARAALAQVESDYRRERNALAQESARLAKRMDELDRAHGIAKAKAEEEVATERLAYQAAGGR